MASAQPPKKRIVFFHPDLGIGGAERLVIDAAVGLQSLGHKVTIFTSHCDPTHCFTEARDGTLDVRVRGNTVPSTIGGRFAILCAIVRQLHLVLSIALFSSELANLKPTDLFVDQLSACVPLLRLLCSNARILFYCHYPDKLLAQRGSGVLAIAKKVYRIPFNWLEAWSTSCSDTVVVNSRFTGGMVRYVFPVLQKKSLKVVYPCVDTSAVQEGQHPVRKSLWPSKRILLSINRFERKKNVGLAIEAFAGLDENERRDARLVIAGGYDPRLDENVSYHKELERLASSFDLKHATISKMAPGAAVDDDVVVLFLPSVSDDLKQSLLDSATLLLYTPQNEHFGIVPLEAMLNLVPVLAAKTGGPLETVLESETGWHKDIGETAAWSSVMQEVLELSRSNPSRLEEMGKRGRAHVTENFSKRKMALRLDKCLDDMKTIRREPMVNVMISTGLAMTAVAIVIAIGLMKLLFYAIEKDSQLDAFYKNDRASREAAAAAAPT